MSPCSISTVMLAQVVNYIDRSGETADMRLRVFSKGGWKIHLVQRDSAMSSGGAAPRVVGSVAQHAADTWQHWDPPPDE
jgi:hypothetical protein